MLSPRMAVALVAACLCTTPARAVTTTYTSAWSGGTIAPGDTVVLNNGASVTGNVVANGTLQFNQSGTTLTVSKIYLCLKSTSSWMLPSRECPFSL